MLAISEIDKLVNRIVLYDDVIAYKELFLLYHSRLISFSSSFTRSKESAEEVVSDVFVKLWNGRHSLARVENLHLYIYIITKNLSINRFLKEKKMMVYSLDEAVVEVNSIYPDPEQLMISSEMIKKIDKAIKDLPPRCQLIFKLIKEDGFKYSEVANLLNLSIKTVENQMTIAIKKIGSSIQFNLVSPALN